MLGGVRQRLVGREHYVGHSLGRQTCGFDPLLEMVTYLDQRTRPAKDPGADERGKAQIDLHTSRQLPSQLRETFGKSAGGRRLLISDVLRVRPVTCGHG